MPTLLCKTDTTELNGTEMSQARWPAITLGVMLLCESGPALAEQSPAERRGFRYVRVHCTQCHAIDKVSASPVTNAPPFRVLNLKYGVADLQRPLAEGVHPMMPLFRLSPGEIEDIMAYLKTLR